MKKVNKKQTTDQVAKGGVMGLFVYAANKWNMDPGLVAILLPMIGAVLAVASQKIGDPTIASFFDTDSED
jgi:uncharacterized protein with ACT and thioredoxin-like domain